MKSLAFAGRYGREMLRAPLSLVFGVGFPVALLLMMSMLQRSIPDMPETLYGIQSFAPGMTVFGLSFLSLFLGC